MNKLSPRIIITSIALVIAFLLGISIGFITRTSIPVPTTITMTIPITILSTTPTTHITTIPTTITITTIVPTTIAIPTTVTTTITTTIPVTHTITYTATTSTTVTYTITTALQPKIGIIDALGRYVEVRQPISRVVALGGYNAVETLLILNMSNVIVGVTSDTYKRIEIGMYQVLNISKIKAVGSFAKPNYEVLVSLRPDLVIAYDRWPTGELEEKLAPLNITVVRFALYRPSTMFQEMAQLAILFGRGKELVNYMSWARSILSLLDEKLRDVKGYKTYFEGYTEWDSAGPGSGWFDLALLARLSLITANFTTPYPRVSKEWVLSQNPSVIIKAVSTTAIMPLTSNISQWKAVWDSIASRLLTTDAVRSGRIILISTPTSPIYPVYILYIAKVLYPDKFADVDPNKYLCEYLKMISTQCKGIWGYAGPDKPILGWSK